MMPKVATALLVIARALGQLLGNELDIVIKEHEIDLEMVKPEQIHEKGRAWDSSHFTEGNIHLEGIANPINVSRNWIGDDADIISSDRYKTYMKNKLMKDIVNETTDTSGLTLFHVLIILATVQFSMTGVIVYLIAF